MNISWLTLRDLEYVVSVAKHEHFGRAARDCHVSQPTLSHQIKKIEGYFGVLLFERTNRRVATTAIGKKVANQAACVLDEARKFPVILDAEAGSSPTLRLGVIATLAPLVPHVLPLLKVVFPGTALALHEATTEELVDELKAGGVDAVLAADTVKDPSLTVIPLFFERMVLAAPKGHRILDLQKPCLADLDASDRKGGAVHDRGQTAGHGFHRRILDRNSTTGARVPGGHA